MNSEHLQLIEDCEARESRLDNWSANFIDSVRRQMEGGRDLTSRQVEKLEEVWGRVTAKG